MSFNLTIEKAVKIAGSQTALSEMIGETQGHISNFKNGTRVCGLKKRIQIAEIAGVDRVRTIFEYFVDSLDDKDAYEDAAKKALQAMLDAFPPETDESPETKKPLGAKSSQGVSWRKRRNTPIPNAETKKPPEGGSLSWRKRKFPNPPITRLAGFFYAYFKLECPGFWTRYMARFIADSDTSYRKASPRMV